MSSARQEPAGPDERAYRRSLLGRVYADDAAAVAAAVEERLAQRGTAPATGTRWDERDAWLITYPDQFLAPDSAPLASLRSFADEWLWPWLNGLHITPFYPWTSDEGYSVVDYVAVDARYGDWPDVAALGERYRLMIDAVVNHLSSESGWFRAFLEGDPGHREFFRTADPRADLSATARPRATPLLTRFEAAEGPRWVWTTFSPDQVDLNYANPQVLLAVLDVLLAYADRGAAALRLDAIAYLWKREGTSSIHLPETHALIRFLRSALSAAHPGLLVVTETNVPHADNVAYFGTAREPGAHAVYQFALPPLVLHTLVRGDAGVLQRWAGEVSPPREDTTFLNFLASHDGVGLRPVEGLLTDDDVASMVTAARAGGGQVSMRTMPDGSSAPYELNATWFSLLCHDGDEQAGLARHLASHAIMLALQGLPMLYVHSLFASTNDRRGFAASGQARSLNRRRFEADELAGLLDDPTSRAGNAWSALRQMLAWRASSPAFDPNSDQRVLDTNHEVFAVERTASTSERARVYVNVTGRPVTVADPDLVGWSDFGESRSSTAELRLGPYAYRWLCR